MPEEEKIWSVTELNGIMRDIVDGSLRPMWVSGEVGNLTLHRSGHAYMTLKDASSQIKAVYFGGANECAKLKVREGSQIEAYGKLSVYMQRGEYQLNIRSLRPMGLGDLQRQFELLKQRLAAEGLFDESRKKPVPYIPARIGLVTSPNGAALHDFLKISLSRFPTLDIKIYPAPVQGRGAERYIAAGVNFFNRYGKVDMIVVTRGGGSLEDLWPFNEEVVARAIAASRIPVVSAVGHEIDFTIADFAADLRAPTPSGAAEMIVPDKAALNETVDSMRTRILASISLAYERAKSRLDSLISSEALRRPSYFVMEKSQEIDTLLKDMSVALDNAVSDADARFRMMQGQLKSLSPFSILNRGYAMIFDSRGKPVTDALEAPPGTLLTARLSKGSLRVRAEGLEE